MPVRPEQENHRGVNKSSATDPSLQSHTHQKNHKVGNLNHNKLQGVNSLVIDAVVKVTDIVESLHHRVNRVASITGHPKTESTSGITGAVYNIVRGITELVGKGLNIPLKVIGNAMQERPDEPALLAMQSALNGVLGDYLESQNNPLSINMHFTSENKELSVQALAETLHDAVEKHNGRVLIMVHGLCMNHRQWCHNGHDHGAGLQRQISAGRGAKTLYLNYNSGLHISQNGQQFTELLQAALETMPSQITASIKLSLVTHSMGGLVSRSALHCAKEAQHQWPDLVDKLVFLGTPHHGAPLEKTGNWLDVILANHPYTKPFAKLIQMRSSGITDLRFGNVSHQDWQQRNRFDFRADNRQIVPLPEDIECFAVAGSIGNFIGDGLVDVDSAHGRHFEKPRTLVFKNRNQLHIKGCDHMQLLSDERVYEKLVQWLE